MKKLLTLTLPLALAVAAFAADVKVSALTRTATNLPTDLVLITRTNPAASLAMSVSSLLEEPPVAVFDGVPTFAGPTTRTNLAAGIVISHSTNRVALTRYVSVMFWPATTNCPLVLPASWNFFGCTVTNTALSNRWTILHLMCIGGTSETNVHAKLEVQ
jgi:hypothetical protein